VKLKRNNVVIKELQKGGTEAREDLEKFFVGKSKIHIRWWWVKQEK
jgi:hypothetical protein